jgi:hypothetical protein
MKKTGGKKSRATVPLNKNPGTSNSKAFQTKENISTPLHRCSVVHTLYVRNHFAS